MFRAVVFVLFAAVAVGGVVALSRGAPFGWVLAIEGGIAAIAVAVQFDRYRRRTGALDASWLRTDERFVDPNSGELVEVWYRPSTGERAYRTPPQIVKDAAGASRTAG